MKKTLPLLLAAILSSCVSTRDVYTPNGSVIYGLTCHLNSQQSCFEKAGELCGTLGYQFVTADGKPAPTPTPVPALTMTMKPADSNGNGNVNNNSNQTDDTGIKLTREMYVRCGTN